jgi:hypothetical protein
MADNVPITAGSGTTVGTDERTINSVAVQVQRVDEQGSTAIATGQVVVTTTAATLVAARDTRKRLILVNNSGNDCWIGPATVTTANGLHLAVGYSVTLFTTALIQAIIASGTMTGDVDYLEEYDS